MKIRNPVSQIIRIFPKINLKRKYRIYLLYNKKKRFVIFNKHEAIILSKNPPKYIKSKVKIRIVGRIYF